jgi:hypothetical protein
MNNVVILGSVAGGLWSVMLALLGVVWAMHRGQIAALEKVVRELQEQNTEQETALGRLTERTLAIVDRHESHREDVINRFDRLEAKIDRLLSLSRSTSPYPGTQRGG